MASSDIKTIKTEYPESQTTVQDHSHVFCYKSKNSDTYEISCKRPCTVLEALLESGTFKKHFKKDIKAQKDIVIEMGYQVTIATHFPCCLIDKDEVFKITFTSRKAEPLDDSPINSVMDKENLVTFFVDTKGGKNSTTKPLLKINTTNILKLCVYAYKGETIENALRRDGRFADIVFQKYCELFETNKKRKLEIESVVDHQNGSHFALLLSCKDRDLGTKQMAKSLSSCTSPESSSSASGQAGQSQNPRQSVHGSHNAAAAKPSIPPSERYKKIADSEEILKLLRAQFKGLVVQMKERETLKPLPKVLRLLREEFGKNTQVFWKMSQMKRLVELSESICLIKISDEPAGTGFLLFDTFILTNAHVIKDNVDKDGNLKDPMTVIFTNKNKSENANLEYSVMQKIVSVSYNMDGQGQVLDYALLRIQADGHQPLGLLDQYGPPPQKGGICIIGYPKDNEQRVDLSSIIENEKRSAAIEKHAAENFFHYINWTEFMVVRPDSQVVSYDTCFFHGSSGSPVFGEHCQLIGVHTGGYYCKEFKSVIEYAIPLLPILEDFLLQIENKNNAPVLSAFIEKAKVCGALHSLIARFIPEEMEGRPP